MTGWCSQYRIESVQASLAFYPLDDTGCQRNYCYYYIICHCFLIFKNVCIIFSHNTVECIIEHTIVIFNWFLTTALVIIKNTTSGTLVKMKYSWELSTYKWQPTSGSSQCPLEDICRYYRSLMKRLVAEWCCRSCATNMIITDIQRLKFCQSKLS